MAISSSGIGSAAAQNRIALAIAGAGKLDAAIEWAKIAIDIYPKEATLYGSLGDFYLKHKRELAIEAYKKALEIDANFEHAKKMLQELMK